MGGVQVLRRFGIKLRFSDTSLTIYRVGIRLLV